MPFTYASNRGCMLGNPVVGAVDDYLQRYGRAAGHEVRARLSETWRTTIDPHAPSLGIMGSRWYPYAFVGELVRTMGAVVHAPDEDAFIRQVSSAGIDASVNTAMRVLLRYAMSPTSLASKGQESWNMFHDSGKVTILAVTANEYVAQVSDWPNHDVTVCKICAEVRRRLIERTGARHVLARRDKCVAWGHGACVTRVRWS